MRSYGSVNTMSSSKAERQIWLHLEMYLLEKITNSSLTLIPFSERRRLIFLKRWQLSVVRRKYFDNCVLMLCGSSSVCQTKGWS
jgi:hypothetical protein